MEYQYLKRRLGVLAKGIYDQLRVVLEADKEKSSVNDKADIVRNSGYCHCCRKKALFKSNNLWLRDHYLCTTCGSIPRQRHIQYILDHKFRGWESMNIHESSPSNNFISRYSKSYSYSQFFPGIEPGELCNKVRCENLEELTFSDETFDIFITQDVFEHIFNPAMAAKEIMRVLKPGGIHIFTAPKHKGIKESYARARMLDGEIEYLHEEQYHGNPVGDGKALVTWDYGDDFERLMEEWSGYATDTYVMNDRTLGIDAEYIEVFVTRKNLS
jgi:hypothetical protein